MLTNGRRFCVKLILSIIMRLRVKSLNFVYLSDKFFTYI